MSRAGSQISGYCNCSSNQTLVQLVQFASRRAAVPAVVGAGATAVIRSPLPLSFVSLRVSALGRGTGSVRSLSSIGWRGGAGRSAVRACVEESRVRSVKGYAHCATMSTLGGTRTCTESGTSEPDTALLGAEVRIPYEAVTIGAEVGVQDVIGIDIWPTRDIDKCLDHVEDFVHQAIKRGQHPRIAGTGGGAVKYASRLKELAATSSPDSDPPSRSTPSSSQCSYATQDEMACLAAGLQYLRQSASDELYSFDSSNMYPQTNTMAIPTSPQSHIHPISLQSGADSERSILLANAGTGVSFVLCPSRSHQRQSAAADTEPARRVGGTPLSGTTLFGLLKLISGNNSLTYPELLALAEQGDSRNVDLLVGDVYGSEYASIGLSGHRAAGFLGRVATENTQREHDTLDADAARSLVFAIGYNIGQQAVLQARVNGAAREVCFTGSFAGGHPLIMAAVDYAVRTNGDGKHTACFLRHESYLGAIGAWALGVSGTTE